MNSFHLLRAACFALTLAAPVSAALAQQQPPAPAQEQPPALVEAQYDEELMIWTLGEQTWEFADVAVTYVPAEGTYDPATREIVWTLQLVKDLTPGEVGFQTVVPGSPFRPMFLDTQKVLLAAEAPVALTPISGKKGDSIRVTIRLPEESTLAKAALIRLERRTQIGF